MEVWYDPDMWGIDRDVAITLAKQKFRLECLEQRNAYMMKMRLTSLEPEVEADYNERIALGLGMLEQYAKVSIQLDGNFRPVYVEKAFEVPIKGPLGETIWCKCERCWTKYVTWYDTEDGKRHEAERLAKAAGERYQPEFTIKIVDRQFGSQHWKMWQGLPVTYGGRVDMLAIDTLERYWIFDWKTAARLSTGEPNAPDDYLFLDSQITSYCWAFKVLGLNVAGFVYHEQKKAIPVEPEPLKTARLGRMYSTNKQMDCDWETYERTVSENDVDGYEHGRYDEFIQYLKDFGGVFHKRHQIERTHTELVNAGLDIYNEALDMTDPDLRIYPAPGRFACGFCAFQDPCLGKNRGDDYLYTLDTMFEKRPKHYYDLQPSTDKPNRG
jgi:hypothetical protein